MAWLRDQPPLSVIVMCGVVVALVLFAVTSQRAPDAPPDFDLQNLDPGGRHLSPYVHDVELSGFDLWTGEPHGWTTRENAHGLGEVVEHGAVPDDIAGRKAIPLPVGFAVGALLGLWLTATSKRGMVSRPTD